MMLDLINHRPTIKDERWKYTSLRALDQFPFLTAEKASFDASLIPALPFETAGQIVYVDGHLMSSSNMNTNIPSDTLIKHPIDCVFIATDAAKSCALNIEQIIEIGESSSVSFIFRSIGLTPEQYVANISRTIRAGKDAQVSIYLIQTQSDNAFHLEQLLVDAKEYANINVHALSLGAQLSRTDVCVNYSGQYAQSNVYGIYHVNQKQHVDFHFDAEHHASHCLTQQHAKGCVDDEARAVFNGRVMVPKQSIKSSSEQSHHGLLLSKRARIDAKPELEIDCDDVQCRHGATVGALRQEALFYLMSRCIDEKTAKSMLELAHVVSLLDKVTHQGIQSYMLDLLRRKYG